MKKEHTGQMTSLIIEQQILRAAVKALARVALPDGGTRPSALAHLLCEYADGALTLTATDAETSCVATIGVEGPDEPLRFTLPARILDAFVATLPHGAVSIAQAKQDRMIVKCGGSQMTLAGLDPQDFLVVPPTPLDAPCFVLNAPAFRGALDRVASAAHPDRVRATLHAVFFERERDGIFLVGADGLQLARSWLPAISLRHTEDFRAIVPLDACRTIVQLLADTTGTVTLTQHQGRLVVFTGQLEYATLVIQGEYPHHRGFVPADQETTVVADRAQLLDAVRAASLLSKDQLFGVRLIFDQGAIRTNARAERGESSAEIPATLIQGQPWWVCINAEILQSALSAWKGTDDIRLETSGPNKPVVLRPHGDQAEQHLHIVMPLETKWDHLTLPEREAVPA